MRAIALAHQNQSPADFEKALRDYKHGTWFSLCLYYLLPTRHTELSSDPTIRSHLAALYDTLLQQNRLRIVEPHSVVEIDYVVKQCNNREITRLRLRRSPALKRYLTPREEAVSHNRCSDNQFT